MTAGAGSETSPTHCHSAGSRCRLRRGRSWTRPCGVGIHGAVRVRSGDCGSCARNGPVRYWPQDNPGGFGPGSRLGGRPRRSAELLSHKTSPTSPSRLINRSAYSAVLVLPVSTTALSTTAGIVRLFGHCFVWSRPSPFKRAIRAEHGVPNLL